MPRRGPELPGPPVADSVPATPLASGRLIALDAFRGITIAAMILVNSPGAGHHG